MSRHRDTAIAALVLAGIVAIAFAFSRETHGMFRLPKTLVLYGEAILLVSVTLGATLLGAAFPRPDWRDRAVAVPLMVLAVMAVATVTSRHTALSLHALGTAVATVVVFLATLAAARGRGWIFLAVPLAAAATNAAIVIAQATRVPHHLQATALVGNPNEVGAYLGAAALAALAAILARWREGGLAWRIAAAAILVAGLVASRTLTGAAAFTAGGVVMFALVSWKGALRAALVAAGAGALVVVLFAPLRDRATFMLRAADRGEYNALLTERLTPFVAAALLFRDHPWTGAGPGTFAWHYYDYKLRAEERYPFLRDAYNRGVNYGEVHNDHLQVLAEGGVLGYAAFLGALGALAAISFARPKEPPGARAQFARRLALPLAVFWLVLSLAQFPLETTVVRSLLVHFAALCAAWRSS